MEKNEIKKLIQKRNAFEFTKGEFEEYISYNPDMDKRHKYFSDKMTTEQMEACFKKQLAKWAIGKYKGAPNAEKHFKKLGGKTVARTLYDWQNLCDTKK